MELLEHLRFAARNFISRRIFAVLRNYCCGDVLDVGGWNFYHAARKQRVPFSSWTVLENRADRLPQLSDGRVKVVLGDGCAMDFADESFDTVLCIHVLEHVFEPLRMVKEIQRVLKRGGHAIFLAPQTANLHMAPDHFQNFTRFWCLKSAETTGMSVEAMVPLGGAWLGTGSRLFHFLLHMIRAHGYTYPEARRNFWFYALFPLACVVIGIAIPLCLLLSLGDMEEEAPNHCVVMRKA